MGLPSVQIIIMNESSVFHPKTEAEQEQLGAALAGACAGAVLIYLQGDLGAGKTTLVRGFLRARGHKGNVKSPTYTLIEPYEQLTPTPVYHLDLYRLGDGEELEYLGLREMLAEQAVLLIEWPERGDGWLPDADLQIDISHLAEGRDVAIRALSDSGKNILERLLT